MSLEQFATVWLPKLRREPGFRRWLSFEVRVLASVIRWPTTCEYSANYAELVGDGASGSLIACGLNQLSISIPKTELNNDTPKLFLKHVKYVVESIGGGS